MKKALALLKHAKAQAAGPLWLEAELMSLQELTLRDREMAAKEMRFSSGRLQSRAVACAEPRYVADETESVEIPALLRRKTQEGTGKRWRS